MMMQFIGINDGFNAEDEEKKKKNLQNQLPVLMLAWVMSR